MAKIAFTRTKTQPSAPVAEEPAATQTTEAAEPKPATRRTRPAARTVPPVETPPAPDTAVSSRTEAPTIDADSGKVVDDNDATPQPAAPKRRARRTAPAPAPEPTQEEAPKPAAPKTRAVVKHQPSSQFEVGGFKDDADDVDPSDLVLPRLNIVQKVGELSEMYEAGVLLLGKKVELSNPCRLLLVGFRAKQYVERVKGGSPGRIVNSLAEVAEAGGTTDYNEAEDRDIPLFQQMATGLVVIEAPEDANEEEKGMFPFEFEGKSYALALWSMKGTAYTHAAKHFFTARRAGLFKGSFTRAMKTGYVNQFVTVGTEIKKYGRNFAAIPVVNLEEETTPEFRTWLAAVLKGNEAAAASADGTDSE